MNFQDHAHFRVLPASPRNLSNTKISGSRSRGSAGGADVTVQIPLGHYELYDQHQFQALTGRARAQLLSRKRLFFFLACLPFIPFAASAWNKQPSRTSGLISFWTFRSRCEIHSDMDLLVNMEACGQTFQLLREWYNINVPHSLIKQ